MALFTLPVVMKYPVHITRGVSSSHNGVDFGTYHTKGIQCYATAYGRIARVDYMAKTGSGLGGYGNCFIIDHLNGYYSLYAHLQTIYAQYGQFVRQGQSVGIIGNTGDSDGEHLHFEIRRGSRGGLSMAGSVFIGLDVENPITLCTGTVAPIPPTISPTEWIVGNRYLSESEAYNNAIIIYVLLMNEGWTTNSICAMLGNMWVESHINPTVWQDLTVNANLGYGLAQWTPSTKYREWSGIADYNSKANGNREVERILWEVANNQQWDKSYSDHNLSFSDFTKSTLDVAVLTREFGQCYERPRDLNATIAERTAKAREYYGYFARINIPDFDLPNNPYEAIPPSERLKLKYGWIYWLRHPLF